MFGNIKVLKIIVLLLVIYSVVATVFVIARSFGSSSSAQIEQLNAQIAQQNVLVGTLQKDNDDLKAIREMMEERRAAEEEAQRRHEEAALGILKNDPFHGDFSRNVFDALKGKPHEDKGEKK
jgi:outer membrane murein-binding lipoprotein Lpp